jgi:hypothetical protein
MKITRKHLEEAVEQQILSTTQADKLMEFLVHRPGAGPSFDFTHVLYYLGGLIAIGAMTLFMNLGWESFGGWGIFFISLAYAGVGFKLSGHFQQRGYAVPAGICATFVVALTPLAIYGIQQGLGVWPDDSAYREYHKYIKWHWLYMEFGTLVVGVLIAWKYKYPFLLMPIAVTLWYMSMDIAAMIAGGRPDFELRALVSLYFGLLNVLLAFWVDVRSRLTADYAFWLYIFGVMAFWGGMTAQHSDSELNKFIYFCINLLMIGIGVLLVRRVFVVFGAIGGCLYLGHLASHVFRDSWLFPVALTVIGLAIIYLGIVWQRNETAITRKVHSVLPGPIRELLDSRLR